MVLANTLGDSPRNYGNRPVNTLNDTSCSGHIMIMLTHYQIMTYLFIFTLLMDYFRSIHSKINVKLARHKVPRTTIQQPLSSCCAGVSFCGEATSKRSALV